MEERMQVKCNYDEEMMHIQGVSETVQRGREYGIAEKVRTTMEVSMWLKEQPPVLKSAASGEVLYTPFSIHKYENGLCQFFIPGTEGNHPKGAVMNLHPLSEKIQKLLKFANDAGFIQEVEGEPYVTEKAEKADIIDIGDLLDGGDEE